MKTKTFKPLCLAVLITFILLGTASLIKASGNGTDNLKQVWCVTFQLVWNDFMDKFTQGTPIELEGGNPKIADELNQRFYTADILSPKSYYKIHAPVNPELKREIEVAIYRKFHEKSDILDLINWNAKDSYLFYVMLKKDFSFLLPFDILKSKSFAGSKIKVKYFGIDDDSSSKLRKNVEVLFYNDKEYAVKLLSRENEEVILFRTDKKGDFRRLYGHLIKNAKSESFKSDDTLTIPNLNIDKTIIYNEFSNKKVLNATKEIFIAEAVQTIKFKMDNNGGTLKSEAALMIKKTSISLNRKRYFAFNEPFIIFLKEKGKDKPYFAARIENTEFLVKE